MIVPTLRTRLARPAHRRFTVAGVLVIGAAAAFAACNVGDQNCTTDSEQKPDDGDACLYGTGRPTIPVQSCSELVGRLPPKPAVCPPWEDVYAMLVRRTGGDCVSSSCHGNGGMEGALEANNAGLTIASNDAAKAYEQILSYNDVTGGKGKYLNAEIPDASWFVCNLRGDLAGGIPMPRPSGLLTTEDISLLENWFVCWMADPEGNGPGAGTGGMGGGDGAGGGA